MPRVVVVGSVNMDVVAAASHHPQVGETVLGSELRMVPGGKGANQAVAAARTGAEVVFVGCVGTDAFGEQLVAFLAAAAVDTTNVHHVDAPTGTALIVVASGDNTIVVVPGANARLTAGDVTAVPLAAGDVLVVQQEISTEAVRAALVHARDAGARAVLNPAPARADAADLLALADVVILNETEASILGAFSAPVVVTTLGARGATAVLGDHTVQEPGRSVRVVDTTGAGDCFVGTFAARLAAGDDTATALHLANVAASLSVQRFGAGPSMPTLVEVMMA
jgi:ribokinase